MKTNKKYRNSKELKASWKMQEFFNWGCVKASDDEEINDIFCRMLNAVNVNFSSTTEDGEMYFVLSESLY